MLALMCQRRVDLRRIVQIDVRWPQYRHKIAENFDVRFRCTALTQSSAENDAEDQKKFALHRSMSWTASF